MEKSKVEQSKKEKDFKPQEGESYIKWLERVGGENVEVRSNLDKHPLRGRKKDRPLIINKEGDIILNDQNILEIYGEKNKEKVDEWVEQNVLHVKKEKGIYEIKKELFEENPDIYFESISGILESGHKVVADKRFEKSLNKWMEELKKEKPKKKEVKEEKKEFNIGDKVMWESQGAMQWKKPQKIIDIKEHKGQKFAFFEGSDTGISVDELTSEKPDKKETKKKKKKPASASKEVTGEAKEPTLDEQIEEKKKEIENIETGYAIYASPVVKSLMSLYYEKEYKELGKMRKELEELEKKRGGEPETLPEEIPEREVVKRKDYLKHLKYVDGLFNEMALTRGKVKREEVNASEYEEIKNKWREAYKKTGELHNNLSEEDQEKHLRKQEKARRKRAEKIGSALWELIVKKVGKEMIDEVIIDAIHEQLKTIKDKREKKRLEKLEQGAKQRLSIRKRLKAISKEFKKREMNVMEQSKLEDEEKKLKKRLKKLNKILK